jgi:hypothetical protein
MAPTRRRLTKRHGAKPHRPAADSAYIIPTMRAAAIPSQGSEFHKFLYAPICVDQEGMTLNVLSAIARQDIDPWSEAARLSQLPQESAAKQIRGLLDALPLSSLDGLERAQMAGRLSALLPRRATFSAAAIMRPPSSAARDPAAAAAFNWRFLCIYFCAMLLMNWLMSHWRAPLSASASETPPVAAETVADSRENLNGRDDSARHAELNSLVREGAIPHGALPPESVTPAMD